MIISRTPLRISFAGGGSDMVDYYAEEADHGAVVSTAIDKYIYITVNEKFDDQIRVSYSKTEVVDSVEKVEHNIIREALKITGVTHGVDIVYMGDIPLATAGIGLGSSSSLAVGALNALYAFQGKHVSAEQLAREACEIEIDILNHPIGKQDQYIAAYGGLNHIQFNADETVFIDPIICKHETKVALSNNLIMFYTGIKRFSSTILDEQKARVSKTATYLHKMVKLADELQHSISENDIGSLGECLHTGWNLKKNLSSNISNGIIDKYYQKAINVGATGGKIAGAGGGGFFLFYCEKDKQAAVIEALSDLKYYPAALEPQGSKIIYVSE